MPSLLNLFYETNSDRLVRGLDDPADYRLRSLYEEDTLPISLTMVKEIPAATEAPFFTRVPASGYGLYISVGLAGSVKADQAVWDTDDSGYIFSGTLDLNQPDLSALPDGSEVIMEIRLSSGTGYLRGQFRTRFYKAVATGAAVAAPPGDVALGQKQADQEFCRKVRKPGEHDIYVSKNGLYRRVVGCDDNGNYVNRRERVNP